MSTFHERATRVVPRTRLDIILEGLWYLCTGVVRGLDVCLEGLAKGLGLRWRVLGTRSVAAW
jgi:hypothetical protein